MKLIKLLSEAKFAVEVEDIGTVIVDGSSEAEVKSRLAKKLKAGKEAIKDVRKITKDTKIINKKRKNLKKNLAILTL
mgnify:CR=1 FL=1